MLQKGIWAIFANIILQSDKHIQQIFFCRRNCQNIWKIRNKWGNRRKGSTNEIGNVRQKLILCSYNFRWIRHFHDYDLIFLWHSNLLPLTNCWTLINSKVASTSVLLFAQKSFSALPSLIFIRTNIFFPNLIKNDNDLIIELKI